MPFTSEDREGLEKLLTDFGFPEVVVRIMVALPELIKPDSDRARVLVACSMIDNALESLLRWQMMATPGVTKADVDFFLTKQPIPPIGSFVVKARLAFVLGLISRETLNGIKYVAKIRNVCATAKNRRQLPRRWATTLALF